MPFFCYECNTHVDAEANAENGFVCSTCGGDFVEETEEAPPPPPAPAFVPMMIPGLPHGPPGGPQNNTAQIQAAQARLQELQAMMQNLVQQMGGAGGGGGGGGGGGPAFMPFFGGGGGGGGGGLFGNHGDYVNEASYQNILNNLLAQESRKRGAPPASPAFLKNLANQAAEEAFPETFAEEACPICQAEYERGDVVNVMAPHCDHAFHRDCIHHWLRMHNTCPVCRTELPTEGYDPSDSESPVEGRLTVRTHPHTLQHCALTSGWFCDGCRVRGFGHRYRCTDGCDFDFCSSCLDSMVVSVPTGEQGEATATSAVDAAPATTTTTASPASTNRNDGGHGDGDGDIDGEFYDSD